MPSPSSPEPQRFEWITYAQLSDIIGAFGRGMRALGVVCPGEFVGVCATNRLEWFVADLNICCLSFSKMQNGRSV